VQQRASDLDPPHLASREVANLVAGAILKTDTFEQGPRAQPRLRRADPVQCGLVAQILHDREIKVEGALLEHHPEPAQRLPGGARHVVIEDRDAGPSWMP
jgi:hypothetical protein